MDSTDGFKELKRELVVTRKLLRQLSPYKDYPEVMMEYISIRKYLVLELVPKYKYFQDA